MRDQRRALCFVAAQQIKDVSVFRLAILGARQRQAAVDLQRPQRGKILLIQVTPMGVDGLAMFELGVQERCGELAGQE
ncbi:hypothetical protein D3C87_2098210 [compost metagenome]